MFKNNIKKLIILSVLSGFFNVFTMPVISNELILHGSASEKANTKEELLLNQLERYPQNIRANIELARLYKNAGLYQKAAFYLKKAKEIDSSEAEIYSIGADVLFKEGHVKDAEYAARKAISLDNNCSAAYVTMGKIYLDKSNSPELLNSFFAYSKKQKILNQSKKYFLKALEINEKNAQAHIALSEYYKSIGNKFKWEDELMKAEELDIYNPETLIALSEFCIENFRFEKALRYLEKADSYSLVSNWYIHYLMGNIYEKLGDFYKARTKYLYTLEFRQYDTEIKQRISKINEILSEMPKKVVETPLVKYQNENEKINKAYFYLICDRETEARDILLEVLKNNPDNIRAISGISELYYTQWLTGYFDLKNYLNDSEYISSINDFNKIKLPIIKNNIVSSQGISQEVKNIMAKMSDIGDSTDITVILEALRASILNEDFQTANKMYELALKDGLSDDFIYELTSILCFDRNYDLALKSVSLMEQGKYSDSAALIKQRIFNKLKTADENCEKGLDSYRKNDYSSAISIFEDNLKFYSTHKRTRVYYALALNKVGNTKKAIDELKKYLILESMYPSEKPDYKFKDIKKMIENWENPVKLK